MNGISDRKQPETLTLLHRIAIHNCTILEARDPHGYPEMEGHVLRREFLAEQNQQPSPAENRPTHPRPA